MERPEFSNPFTNGKVIGQNIDPKEYHRRDEKVLRGNPAFVMSRSELMTFDENPWKWINGVEDDGSKSTDWGDLMDCVLLAPDRFDAQFVVAPPTYPANAKSTAVVNGECEVGDPLPWDGTASFCKKWKKENAEGRRVIKSTEMDDVDKAQEVLYSADPGIARVLQNSRKQVMVTAEYRDHATGLVVPFKILIDLLPDQVPDREDGQRDEVSRSIMDFKTAQTAEPREWAKALFRFQYHVQSSCYLDVYAAAVPGEERDRFKHIVQENTAPFYPMRHGVSDTLLRLGRDAYVPALRKYCRCVKDRQWPGYPALPGQIIIDGYHDALAPDWALK